MLTCRNAVSSVTQMVSVGVRNVALSWQAPTRNIDGTRATNLQGYRIYTVNGSSYERALAQTTSARLAFPPGTYELVITAYNSLGEESGYSNRVRKTSP